MLLAAFFSVDICSGFVFFLPPILFYPLLSFPHTLIFVPPLFPYPCWAENSNLTWKFLRHSKVFMYFHKSLHYFFIVLSYIGFSFSSTLLVWGSILVFYVLLVVKGAKYLLFCCWFGTIFKLPFFSLWLPLFLPWRACFMSDLLLVVNWLWFHQAIGKSAAHYREKSCFELLCYFFFLAWGVWNELSHHYPGDCESYLPSIKFGSKTEDLSWRRIYFSHTDKIVQV